MLTGENAGYLEDLYQKFLQGSDEVPDEWKAYFSGLGSSSVVATPASSMGTERRREVQDMAFQNLLNTYRKFGHRAAALDPLKIAVPDRRLIDEKLRTLPESFLSEDVDSGIAILGRAPLRNVIDWMEKTYCGSIGSDHFYLVDDNEREWLQAELESNACSLEISEEQRLHIFRQLVEAEEFERFLARKYVGKKRFSLEGNETLIPLLDLLVEDSGEREIDEIVIGMAHRGRLNVLENIMHKPASLIFAEFEERAGESQFEDSDVKYHLGYSTMHETASGHEVHLSLMFNPSHLEAVNPVALGSVRARQKRHADTERRKNIGVLIHGDAAFAGQGVVAETLNLMNLEGYDTGGTVHIITNNQIGFTTLPSDSRSTLYSTDLAKGFQMPIFHVNGDDPDAVYRIMRLALKYRARYNKDVMIDLVGYRRLGHNETDEPAFTQPEMYNVIKKHPTVTEIYERKLLADGISPEKTNAIKKQVREDLEKSFEATRTEDVHIFVDSMRGVWKDYSDHETEKPDTKLSQDVIAGFSSVLKSFPGSFKPHKKIARVMQSRVEMYSGEQPLDWGAGEALAFAATVSSGHSLRLSGQDSQRGTFSHRQAVLHDVKTGEPLTPLSSMIKEGAKLEIINSPLSEFAVLGFEYGYSLSDPDSLIIWEAQFGDFANGAQVIIDQFIASSEVKWHRLSGLVMLLPHGYEGQGPEHSSARIERYLQLCSKKNIRVVYPTTPAQYFHMLRRQVLSKEKKPLIVFTPKSLLRSPQAVSPLSDFTEGEFQQIISDTTVDEKQVEVLALLSGKVFYDVDAYRKEKDLKKLAIARVEELYPFNYDLAAKIIFSYPNLKKIVWLQEEPVNMGAWFVMKNRIERTLGDKQVEIEVIARKASPSPAAGLHKIHLAEQQKILSRLSELFN